MRAKRFAAKRREAEISWRVEQLGRWLLADGAALMPGTCGYCGLPMPGGQTGRCVLCCLAAAAFLAAFLEGRNQAETTGRHIAKSPVLLTHPRETRPRKYNKYNWDTSHEGRDAA